MRTTTMALVAAFGLFAAGGAQAMPTATAPASNPDRGLTLVRDGCGFGAHQGRFGGCRLNNGPRGYMRGMMGGAPRGCPPGTHPTGRGFCISNRY